MKSTNTKRALLMSILSMMLCMAMLVGSTFAWFTDSVSSGKNKIVAGNLDVELEHSNEKVAAETVNAETKLFVGAGEEAIQWEPGVMVYENFTVKNVGSLALKYRLTLNAECNTVDGKSLKDVLKVAILDEAFSGNREDAMKLDFKHTISEFEKPGNLKADEAGKVGDTYAVVIYWEPSANDNDYNFNNDRKDLEKLYVELGVNLVATQDIAENDSFGNDYDANAKFSMVVAAIHDAINQGAVDSNAAFEKVLADAGITDDKGIYFDNEMKSEKDGAKAITLHISDAAFQNNSVLKAGIFSVIDLIESAVAKEVANISSIEIGYGYNLEDQVKNINGTDAPENGWVAWDLYNVLETYGSDTNAALNEVLKKGIDVKIDDMSGGSQIFRMYFDIEGVDLP